MTDINSLFKKSSESSTAGPATKKRRLDDLSSLLDKYKSGTSDDSSLPGPSKVRDDLDDNVAENADLPDEPLEDEEGGRFFGGGLSEEQKDVIDFVNNYDDQLGDEKYDKVWIRKQISKLDRIIKRNTQQRVKFYDNPSKFLDSEEELDRTIKSLSVLTEHTELYPAFVEHEGLQMISSLLAHENTDIVVGAIQLFEELTDEDVQAEEADLEVLLTAAAESGMLDELIVNLTRLDDSRRVRGSEDKPIREGEDEEPERAGVFQILNVIENFTALQTTTDILLVNNSGKGGAGDTSLLPWLLQRILVKEKPVSQNKQYAAEVLSIILQKSRISRLHFARQEYNDKNLGELSGVDALLRALASYRHFDPPVEDVEAVEFFENVFDSLSIVVQEDLGKDKLLENEGVELLLMIVKSGGKHGKARAVKVLDYALSSGGSSPLAIDFVNNSGLVPLFKQFMSSRFAEAKYHRSAEKGSVSHVSLDALLGIIGSLFRNLPESSEQKLKLVARFVEKSYEKIARLLQLRNFTTERMDRTDIVIEGERTAFLKTKPTKADDLEDWESDLEVRDAEWYLQRLDNGGYRLQLIDIVIAWLVAEDGDDDLGIKTEILKQLKEGNATLNDVKNTLEAYRNEIMPKSEFEEGEVSSDANEDAEQRYEASDLAEMLTVLMEFL
ncbi:Catenin-beta-like protein [Lipomyces arxii]|uniref:Catenin-beta-like protein n=1 Tax=Lipomyces arxii TaxID=56418 RepID=UPI0034CD8189